MECEVRHFLHTHDRLPPKRRSIPDHPAGLRQFVIADASVLLDKTGALTGNTLDTVLCLHSNAQRAATVVASLSARALPLVNDCDVYEAERDDDDGESDLNSLFDTIHDEGGENTNNDGRDGNELADTELLALYIGDDEFVHDDAYTVHTRKLPVTEF